jgi:hypothetical protein
MLNSSEYRAVESACVFVRGFARVSVRLKEHCDSLWGKHIGFEGVQLLAEAARRNSTLKELK